MMDACEVEGSNNTYDFWELSRSGMQEELWRRTSNLWKDPERRKLVFTERDPLAFPYFMAAGYYQSGSQPMSLH